MKPATIMQNPEAGKTTMTMEHPLTVIVVPGTALIWQNGSIPLMRM
jgi:hypothetical protein